MRSIRTLDAVKTTNTRKLRITIRTLKLFNFILVVILLHFLQDRWLCKFCNKNKIRKYGTYRNGLRDGWNCWWVCWIHQWKLRNWCGVFWSSFPTSTWMRPREVRILHWKPPTHVSSTLLSGRRTLKLFNFILVVILLHFLQDHRLYKFCNGNKIRGTLQQVRKDVRDGWNCWWVCWIHQWKLRNWCEVF